MRNLLRHIALISLGLLALILIQLTGVGTALAGGDPIDDYGGYSDCWEDDCLCGDESIPQPEPEPPVDECPPPECEPYNSVGGCTVDITACPEPAGPPVRVNCFLYPSSMPSAMMAGEPDFGPLQDAHRLWLDAFKASLLPNQQMYIRLMNCGAGRSRVAAMHIVTIPAGDLVPKDDYFMECSRAMAASTGGGQQALWQMPIDPDCASDPYVYDN